MPNSTGKLQLFIERCICYAGVRADGNVAGSDFIDAVHFRIEELKKTK
jgi:hypothetical protein